VISTLLALFVASGAFHLAQADWNWVNGQCTPADRGIWESRGKANIATDTHDCTSQFNPMQVPEMAGCVMQKEQYTLGCSMCFGRLVRCSSIHCIFDCAGKGTEWQSQSCKTCVYNSCIGAGNWNFQNCAGVADVPNPNVARKLRASSREQESSSAIVDFAISGAFRNQEATIRV